ncbi:MAG: SRPBCC domain-containing protein [Methanobacterium paludis]|nr:SRPBCC domain-containing protein [Methanobacterium paludis]
MTLRHVGLPSAMVEPTGLGWEQSFDKLAEHLASFEIGEN